MMNRKSLIKIKEYINGSRLSRPSPEWQETVPTEMAGRYVAWSADGLRILGHGATIEEAQASVRTSAQVLIQWIPAADQLRGVGPAVEHPEPQAVQA